MAARGNSVVITAHPQGRYLEGIIEGTPKPGSCLSIKTPYYEGGWHLWEPFAPTSGHRRLVAVLLEDRAQGKTISDAYTTLTRCFIYCPIPGEELNMLIDDVAGTGDSHAVLEMLMIQTATGKLIAESSPESEPFQLLTALSALTEDTLAPCVYTGY